jgi:hypothetical protein
MTARFRQLFPLGQRTKKLNVISTVTSASGDNIECKGVFPIPFEIDNKNLSEDFILGINFFQDAGLAYDTGN